MIHTFLLDLPDVLEGMGFNVEVADGYPEGQGNYLWTNPHTGRGSYDEQPFGYMVHHSASSAATPPPHDTSKASAWIGLKRGTRLYQEGGGIPTIYLASAGPARISSGYGYRPALWDYTFQQRRAPAKAQGSDNKTAGNRYTFNVETVHRGDGSPIDEGVLACVIGLGVALEQMTGLDEMTLGHLSWSRRKIDPYWNNDRECIIQVQEAVAGGETEDEVTYKNGDSGTNVVKIQDYINRWIGEYSIQLAPLNKDGNFGPMTEDYVLEFQQWSNIEESKQWDWFTGDAMSTAIGPDTGV